MRLLPIKEALLLNNPDLIADQIHLRKVLIRKMVGQLYPGILTDEIGSLVERFDFVRGDLRLGDLLWKRIQEDDAKIAAESRGPTISAHLVSWKFSEPCPHPARNGNHEVYVRPGGGYYCRACGAESSPTG